MSENILDGIDKIETPGEDYFTQTKAEYMPLDKVIFEQKDRIAELEAINAEMLTELENQQKECWFYRMIDDCSTCGRRRNECSLCKVVNKAKGN